MRVFNAFQLVIGYALAPFGISWLSEQVFRGSGIAFGVAIVGYIIYTGILSVIVATGMRGWDK